MSEKNLLNLNMFYSGREEEIKNMKNILDELKFNCCMPCCVSHIFIFIIDWVSNLRDPITLTLFDTITTQGQVQVTSLTSII